MHSHIDQNRECSKLWRKIHFCIYFLNHLMHIFTRSDAITNDIDVWLSVVCLKSSKVCHPRHLNYSNWERKMDTGADYEMTIWQIFKETRRIFIMICVKCFLTLSSSFFVAVSLVRFLCRETSKWERIFNILKVFYISAHGKNKMWRLMILFIPCRFSLYINDVKGAWLYFLMHFFLIVYSLFMKL